MTETPSPARLHLTLWVLQAVLAFLFGASGLWKLLTPPDALLAQGMTWVARFPPGFSRFVGLVELLGAVGLVAPAATRISPRLTPAAAAGLTLTMTVAAIDHLRAAELSVTPPSVVLAALSAFVAWGRTARAPIAPREA